jgi:hypothetical protein
MMTVELIPEILRSKRFWTAVGVIIAMLVVVLVPDFQSAETELVTAIAVIGVATSAGYSIEDWLETVYPSISEFVDATPSELDDNALALLITLLKVRYPGLTLEKPSVQVVNVAPEAPAEAPAS